MTHDERLAQARFKRDYWTREVARLEAQIPPPPVREPTDEERHADMRKAHPMLTVK